MTKGNEDNINEHEPFCIEIIWTQHVGFNKYEIKGIGFITVYYQRAYRSQYSLFLIKYVHHPILLVNTKEFGHTLCHAILSQLECLFSQIIFNFGTIPFVSSQFSIHLR